VKNQLTQPMTLAEFAFRMRIYSEMDDPQCRCPNTFVETSTGDAYLLAIETANHCHKIEADCHGAVSDSTIRLEVCRNGETKAVQVVEGKLNLGTWLEITETIIKWELQKL